MPQERQEKRIDQLPVLSEVVGTERIPIEDGGVAKSVLVSVLLDCVGGGVSSEAVALLGTILRNALYNNNQSGNITALLEELSGGGSGPTPPEPTADDVTLDNGVLTIISTGAAVTLSDGVLTFS